MSIRLFSLALIFLINTGCLKDESISPDVNDFTTVSERDVMNPGADPSLRLDLANVNIISPIIPWERLMYIDKTDTIYNTFAGKRLAGYLKRYGFTGVYMYKTSTLLSSSSNYTMFGDFMKTLNDSGIVSRAVASGSSTTFTSSGNVTKFNLSQTALSRKINRANLELEWWNGASSWSTWNNTNKAISQGTVPDNDFYEGWYKNLSVVDTIAARDQVIYSDRILLHCYQNGYPTYSYANAQSSGATGGRLDIIAKGARQANKRIDLYIIISAERKAFGANNDFSGKVLQDAYLNGQLNPYLYVETQAYNGIYNNMTTFHKQWINFKGFVWFTKRYCYYAVPPM